MSRAAMLPELSAGHVPTTASVARRAVRRARALAVLALLGSAAACDSPDPVGVPAPAPVASVAVTGAAALTVGGTTTLQATPKDADGQPLTGRDVQWSSTNATVAVVSQAGVVTALAAGQATIRATSEGRTGQLAVEVSPPPVDAVELDVATIVLEIGGTRQVVVTPRDAQGAPIAGLPVAWSVMSGTATPVVSVSVAGVVTALRMGEATIVAHVGGRSAQATVTVLGDSPFDLVFDRWSDLGGLNHPWLHRLDLRTPGAVPAGIFASPGSWEAAPSPDGTRIAFTCANGAPAICVANADGSGLVALPGFSQLGGMLGDQPAWSPDGSRIAFRGWMPGGPVGIFNPGDIWVMNADGSGKVRLTNGAATVDTYASPAWSPQPQDGGYRIAFVHEVRGGDGAMRASIQSMRADGQDRRPVTAAGDHADGEPTWSPDGATIAFVRTGGEAGGDIWLASAAGGGERALMSAAVEPSGAQRAPAWSPDGALIAFASSHEIIDTYFAWQVYTVRADGTGLERRTSDRMEKGNPAWIRRP